MNLRQLRDLILLLAIGIHLIIATTEAVDSVEVGSSATAESEKVTRKLKTPSGKKIVRKIRVLEPNSYKEAEPQSPQATASNNIEVSPAIDIKVPTLSAQSQSSPQADTSNNQPQQPSAQPHQAQPLINSNNNVASPTQQQIEPVPQDLKSPNTKIRQVDYKPSRKTPKEDGQQIVQSPDNDDQQNQLINLDTPGLLETPGLPGVPVTTPEQTNDQIVPYRMPNELKHLVEPNEANNEMPSHSIVPYQGPTTNPMNNLSQPQMFPHQMPNTPNIYNQQIMPNPHMMMPNQQQHMPMMIPNNSLLNRQQLLAALNNAPTNVQAEIGNNKSINMGNVGNSHSTYINAPTHNPANNLMSMVQPPTQPMYQPQVQQVSNIAQDEYSPKSKRRLRKNRNKMALESSGEFNGQQDQRVVVPPIFIQYNQAPNTNQQQPQQIPQVQQAPLVTSSTTPVIVSKAEPIYVSSLPYNLNTIQSVPPTVMSGASESINNLVITPSGVFQNQRMMPVLPTPASQQINYLDPMWMQYNNMRASLLAQNASPYMRYYLPTMLYPPTSYPVTRAASEFPPQYRHTQNQSNYGPYPGWTVPPPVMPPFQYNPYPYMYPTAYPVPVPVPQYMRPQQQPKTPSPEFVEPIDYSNRNEILRREIEKSINKMQPKNREPQVLEDENKEIEYVERQRTVPVDYDEKETENQEPQTESQEETTETNVEPQTKPSDKSTNNQEEKNELEWTTIRVPKVRKSVKEEGPQQKFKTITERVPVSSTTIKTSSVLPGASKSS